MLAACMFCRRSLYALSLSLSLTHTHTHLGKDAGGLYVLQAQLVAEGRVHEARHALAERRDVCALVAVFLFTIQKAHNIQDTKTHIVLFRKHTIEDVCVFNFSGIKNIENHEKHNK